MKHFLNPDCPFCNAAIENAIFESRGEFLALYNAAPILPGHSLVIPKWHVSSLLELSDNEVSDMVLFSRLIVDNLMRIFGASGFNWTIQEGEAAGQTVPHLHLHLIPRSVNDLPEPGDWYPRLRKSTSEQIDSAERQTLTRHEMVTIVQRIRSSWKPLDRRWPKRQP